MIPRSMADESLMVHNYFIDVIAKPKYRKESRLTNMDKDRTGGDIQQT